MKDLIRDTIFSHILRLLTGGKVFKYPEEEDPSLWKKYVHAEKSANMARHGQTEAPEDDGERQSRRSQTRSSSSDTAVSSGEGRTVNEPIGRIVDKEKGKDVHVVDWYGPDDPEVSLLSILYYSVLTDTEPQELVTHQEILRYLRDLPPHLLRLHRLRHLHSRHPRCDASLWCLSSCCHSWPHSLRRWLWSRSYGLVSTL